MFLGLAKIFTASILGLLLAISGVALVGASAAELIILFLPLWAALAIVGAASPPFGGGLYLTRRMTRSSKRRTRDRVAIER